MKRKIAAVAAFFLGFVMLMQGQEYQVKAAVDWPSYLAQNWQKCEEKFNSYDRTTGLTPWDGASVQPTETDADGKLKIYTPSQFRWAMEQNRSCILMNDLDMGGNQAAPKNWTPVNSTVVKEFIIDGNQKTVYNLYINGGATQGLFGTVQNSGFEMKDLTFKYANIYASGQRSSVIVGHLLGGKLYHCSVEDSKVKGLNFVGAVATGWGSGDSSNDFSNPQTIIDQCHTKNVFTYGTSCVGNFMGPIQNARVTNSYAIDGITVSTAGHSGGFVSCPSRTWVENCFSNITMYGNTTTSLFVGVPHYSNHFEKCYSAGVVEGQSGIGGFAGAVNMSAHSDFVNCYSTSMVGMMYGGANMGGFAGDAGVEMAFQNCYSAGEVGSLETTPTTPTVEGFAGAGGTFTNCSYDKQTSAMREKGVRGGISGRLTKDMIGTEVSWLDDGIWSKRDGVYPQLKSFTQPDTFDYEEDKLRAKAYSMASVCTSSLSYDKTNESTYDTVRNIVYLFPLSNNISVKDNTFDIKWTARDIKSSVVGNNDIQVISLSEYPNYAVSNLAPGIGWLDVEAEYTDPENGSKMIGRRAMRLVPTTTLSVATDAGVDHVRYVGLDKGYDHKEGVSFSKGSAMDLESGKLVTQKYPDTEDFIDVELGSSDPNTQVGGTVTVEVVKDKGTDKEKKIDLSLDEWKDLFNENRDITEDDKGVYTFTYKWSPDGASGNNLVSTKTLTIRDPLVVTYRYNDGVHDDTEDSFDTKDKLRINDTVGALPSSNPTKTGHTFEGWASKSDASAADFTAETKVKDSMNVYAVWKPIPYQVSAVKTGRGTIGGSGTYNYGTDAKVTWKADAGYHVKQVFVDGAIRDDLVKAGEITFADIAANHTVYVEFETGEASPDLPHYQIITKKTGGSNGCFLTNSASVKKGENREVSWKAADGYEVTEVIVDGIRQDVKNEGSIKFSGINKDHVVEVVFRKTGGGENIYVDPNYAAINTSKVGNGTIDQSVSVEKGKDQTITWHADAGNHVKQVIVDGKDRTDLIASGQITFQDISRDHTVEVIFEPDSGTVSDPKYRIETQILGGPGNITPSAEVKQGENYTVQWDMAAADHKYTVKDVFVDGVKKDLPGGQIAFDNIAGNHNVTVVLEPNLFRIESSKEGEGRIDSGKTVFYGDSCTITYEPAAGWRLKEVVVDGVSSTDSSVTFNNIDDNHKVHAVFEKIDGSADDSRKYNISTILEGGTGSITPGAVLTDGSDYTVEWDIEDGFEIESVTVKVGEVEKTSLVTGNKVDFNDISDDGQVHVKLRPSGKKGTDPSDDTKKTYVVETSITGGSGTITPTLVNLPEKSSPQVAWSCEEGTVIKAIYVDGIIRDDLLGKKDLIFPEISRNHKVEVILAQSSSDTGGNKDSYQINTSQSGKGQVSDSSSVKKGEDHTVNFKPEPGYQVGKVVVDGVERDDLKNAGSIQFEGVASDHTVYIEFVKDDGSAAGKQFDITTSIGGGEGTISPSSKVEAGTNKEVQWKPKEGYEVSAVIVDGVIRDDLKDKGKTSFNGVNGNHSVEVLYKKKDSSSSQKDPDYVEIKTSREGKGNISDSVVIGRGDSHTVSWKPAPGYKVAGVIIDGVNTDSLADAGKVQFKDAASNHSVHVVFVREDGTETGPSYQIDTSVSGGKGSITAGGDVEKGGSYQVVWKPAKGYEVQKVIVDGVERKDLKNAGKIDFKNVSGNHTVEVVYQKEQKNSGNTADDPSKDKNKKKKKKDEDSGRFHAGGSEERSNRVLRKGVAETGDENRGAMELIFLAVSAGALYTIIKKKWNFK